MRRRIPPPRVRAWLVALGGAALAAVGLLVSVFYPALPGTAGAAPRVNVVLILADDMRFDGLVAMPTVRALAERGISFTNAIVTTPLCCPSRASILTGRYARNHGVRANEPPLGGYAAFDDRSTLATWLQSAGVRTGLVGRYLNGYRAKRVPPGWDYWFALLQQGDDNGLYFRYHANFGGDEEFYGSSSEKYSTRVLGRRARDFLRQDLERPFLLLFAPRAPHPPSTPDPRDAGTYRDAELAISPAYDEEDVSGKPAAIRELPRFTQADRDRHDGARRRQLEALVGLDREVASLIDRLRADGRLEQTWIIFTSDNGLTIGEHRLDIGKSCPYEECVRVPLIIVPPGGLDAPRTDDRLVANIDLAPTIAAIIGAEIDGPVDGQSLVPIAHGEDVPWRDAIVLEQWRSSVSDDTFVGLRTADRKFVRHDTGEEELYDLAADPYELSNVAALPSWRPERNRLSQRLDQLLAAGR